MKNILSLLFVLITVFTFAGSIEIDEKNVSFSAGSKNAIVVKIPHVSKDFMEKKIKEEVKNWDGKYNSSKGEFSSTQGKISEMGEKMFDGYAKIIEEKDGFVFVAFAFDLGGAYLTSSDHKEQFNAISRRIKEFAINSSKDSVAEELKDQEKVLKSLNKEQENLVSDKVSLEKSIEEYTKRIEEAKKKIEENIKNQETKKNEIKTQETKVNEVSTKLGGIK